MGLIHMLDPRHLNLIVSQVQENMNLTRMPHLRHMDLAVSQVQASWV
jgi:hypothetical protein